MFSHKELNLQQIRWLELLKDYHMSVFYHPGKANMVADALNHITTGIVSHVEESKKDLVKDVHKLATLGVRLEYFRNGSFLVHHNSQESLVFK